MHLVGFIIRRDYKPKLRSRVTKLHCIFVSLEVLILSL